MDMLEKVVLGMGNCEVVGGGGERELGDWRGWGEREKANMSFFYI